MIKISQLAFSSGPWIDLWKVDSESRAGVSYIVGRKADRRLGCSCPAWIYQKGERKPCKHVNAVLTRLASLNAGLMPVLTVDAVRADPKLERSLAAFRSLIFRGCRMLWFAYNLLRVFASLAGGAIIAGLLVLVAEMIYSALVMLGVI